MGLVPRALCVVPMFGKITGPPCNDTGHSSILKCATGAHCPAAMSLGFVLIQSSNEGLPTIRLMRIGATTDGTTHVLRVQRTRSAIKFMDSLDWPAPKHTWDCSDRSNFVCVRAHPHREMSLTVVSGAHRRPLDNLLLERLTQLSLRNKTARHDGG